MKKLWQRKTSKEVKEGSRRKIIPAKLGLLGFLVFCLAVLAWDINSGGVLGISGVAAEDIPQPALAEPSLPVDAEPAEEGDRVPPPEEEVRSAMFAAYRLDREQSRDQELELLQVIINDPESSPEVVDQAEQRRLSIAGDIQEEALAESLLSAKGFGETVVLLGATQATVVCSVQLDAVKAANIAEIVSESCNVGYENVVIVNR